MNDLRPGWATPGLVRLNATGRAENDPDLAPEVDSTVEGGPSGPGGFS